MIWQIIISACVLFIAQTIGRGQGTDPIMKMREGERLFYQGYYDSSILYFGEAAVAFEKQVDYPHLIAARYAVGESLANLGKCDEAANAIGTALGKAVEIGLDTAIANGHYYMARALGGCGRKYQEAIAHLHQAIRSNRKAKNREQEIAICETFLGYSFNSTSDYDSAQYYLNRALPVLEAESAADPIPLSHALFYLASTLENTDDIKEALELHLRALSIRQSRLQADHPTISNSINSLGNIYRRFGNFERALSYYKQALQIRKNTLGENHPNVGASYYTIGNLCGNMHNYPRAIHFIEEGNRIFLKAFGEKTPVLYTYYAYLGVMYGKLNKLDQAEALLKKAEQLAVSRLPSEHPYRAIIYNFFGDYLADQEGEQQFDYFKKALDIYRKGESNTTREADILTKLGVYAAAHASPEAALPYFRKAEIIYHARLGGKNSKLAEICLKIGNLYRDLNRPDSALARYQRGLSMISEDTRPAEMSVQSLTDQPLGLSLLQAIALYHSQRFDKNHSVNELINSLRTYDKCMALINHMLAGYNLELSRAKFQQESRGIYEAAFETTLQLFELTGNESYKQQAFQISERSKSYLLLAKMLDPEARQFGGVGDSVLQQERDLQIELAYYNQLLRNARHKNNAADIARQQKNVFEIQSEYDALVDDLRRHYPEYHRFKYQPRLAGASELAALLKPGQGLIEFFVTGSLCYAFIITNDTFEVSPAISMAAIMPAVRQFQRALTDQQLILNNSSEADSLYATSAYKLFNLLLNNPLSKSEGIQRLTIIPEGPLSQINFNLTLQSPAHFPIKYQQLDYLMRARNVSYSHSALWWVHARPRGKSSRMAGFAPSYQAAAYSTIDSASHPMTFVLVRDGKLPLPGAQAEVAEICTLMRGDAWTGAAASESFFKKEGVNYGIVHLAMHSLINTEEPAYSELLFNSENDSLNDGFLNINEIYNLDLGADLAVLSACNSGRGKLQTGEGPISFSRAFSYAGCPSVVMSMWKIPDEPTRAIMKAFYQNLKAGYRKDAALKQAQLNYLATAEDPVYRHPFFWGSFVATGNMEPLAMAHRLNTNKMIWALLIGFAVLAALSLGMVSQFLKKARGH